MRPANRVEQQRTGEHIQRHTAALSRSCCNRCPLIERITCLLSPSASPAAWSTSALARQASLPPLPSSSANEPRLRRTCCLKNANCCFHGSLSTQSCGPSGGSVPLSARLLLGPAKVPETNGESGASQRLLAQAKSCSWRVKSAEAGRGGAKLSARLHCQLSSLPTISRQYLARPLDRLAVATGTRRARHKQEEKQLPPLSPRARDSERANSTAAQTIWTTSMARLLVVDDDDERRELNRLKLSNLAQLKHPAGLRSPSTLGKAGE